MKTYLVYDKGSNLIKIGKAIDVESRMRQLQIGCGSILELLYVFNVDIEYPLHKELKHKRVQGEWFDVTADEVLRAVNENDFLRRLAFDPLEPKDIELSASAHYTLIRNKWIKKLAVGGTHPIPMDFNTKYIEKMCEEYGYQSGKMFSVLLSKGVVSRVG